MSKTKTQSKTKKRPQQPQYLTPELTKLYPLTKKLINDWANSIIEMHLKPYINKYIKKELCMSGSVKEYFWSPKFIDPILENAIVEVLNQTAETCSKAKRDLDPEPYLWEASQHLKTMLVGRIYDYMAYIDKTMRGKDWPEHKIRLRVSDKIAKMSELVEQHAAAVNLISVSPQPQTPPEIELIEQIANELEECVRTEPDDRVPAKLGHYLRDIKSLEGFSTVLEWLQWHKPAVADWVEKKYNKLFLDIKAIDQAIADSNSWLRPMCALQNLQRDIVELAKGLRHIAEMARSDLTPKKPTEAKHDITPSEEQEEKAKEIPSINIQDSNVILGDVQAKNLQIGDDARIDKHPVPEKPAETGQKEIVEVKPGVFGITVDIKELARRFWKWVCFRSKD